MLVTKQNIMAKLIRNSLVSCSLALAAQVSFAAPVYSDYKCYAVASDGNAYLMGGYALSEKQARTKMTGQKVRNKKTGKEFSIRYVPECTLVSKKFISKKAQELDHNSAY